MACKFMRSIVAFLFRKASVVIATTASGKDRSGGQDLICPRHGRPLAGVGLTDARRLERRQPLAVGNLDAARWHNLRRLLTSQIKGETILFIN
jgi:hypothetical protein